MAVYYARLGHLIKIGYSANPQRRVRGLNARLLAFEPGGVDVEKERHARFAHLRCVGEWFEPGDDLLGYIAAIPPAERWEKLLTPGQVARAFNVTTDTVRRWARLGRLTPIVLPTPTMRRYRTSEVQRLLADRGTAA